ncbi:MAG: DUF5684 domain-containing protein [Patescibacteria group bacterium]|nr:DUF5684 domain-containing protein [Patescibacteria group bacterium]
MSMLLAQTTSDDLESLESALESSSTVDLTELTTTAASPWSAWAAFFSGTMMFVNLLAYAYYALVLQFIANKTKTPNGWYAWIPILNIVLMLQIAKMPIWYIILFLIPFVNIVIAIMVWVKIFEACGKPGWWVILLFIPIVNLIIMGITAFGNDTKAPTAPAVPNQQ